MTAIMLDRQASVVVRPGSEPKASTNSIGARVRRSPPAGRTQLTCRWHHAADGRLSCFWVETGRDDLSPAI